MAVAGAGAGAVVAAVAAAVVAAAASAAVAAAVVLVRCNTSLRWGKHAGRQMVRRLLPASCYVVAAWAVARIGHMSWYRNRKPQKPSQTSLGGRMRSCWCLNITRERARKTCKHNLIPRSGPRRPQAQGIPDHLAAGQGKLEARRTEPMANPFEDTAGRALQLGRMPGSRRKEERLFFELAQGVESSWHRMPAQTRRRCGSDAWSTSKGRGLGASR